MEKYKTHKTKYFEFTPGWSGFNITYHVADNSDYKPKAMFQIYLFWGKLFIYLPWRHYKKVERQKTLKELRKNKLNIVADNNYKVKKVYDKVYYDDVETPTYGFYFYMNSIWLRLGNKSKSYDMPWCLDWVRTSALDKNGEWIHENKENRNHDFWDNEKWKDILFYEAHPYQYTTKNGEVQNCLATIRIEEREWRWKWFKWFKYFGHINKFIEIEFSEEVGERKNSYKGGCTGCNYIMKKGETWLDTLKRMEKDRKFR